MVCFVLTVFVSFDISVLEVAIAERESWFAKEYSISSSCLLELFAADYAR